MVDHLEMHFYLQKGHACDDGTTFRTPVLTPGMACWGWYTYGTHILTCRVAMWGWYRRRETHFYLCNGFVRMIEAYFYFRKGCVRIVDLLGMCFVVRKHFVHARCSIHAFDLWKGLVRMVHILYTRFVITKSCVIWLDVWYTRLDFWKGVRMVDVLETHFDFRKGCWRIVYVLKHVFTSGNVMSHD